jgi:glycerol-3-phosphate dehydrogenase
MSEGLKAVRKSFENKGIVGVEAFEWRKSVVLAGRVATWNDKVEAGFAAAKKGFKGVVNAIEVAGVSPDRMSMPSVKDAALSGKKFDVVVVGGGIIGSSIARELSRYDLRIALLEKEEDLAKHASSRNDGMIHPGFAAKPGSLKAIYNVRGNRLYYKVSKELGFEFRRVGSLVLYGHSYSKTVTRSSSSEQAQRRGRLRVHQKEKSRGVSDLTLPRNSTARFFSVHGDLSPYRACIAYAENPSGTGSRYLRSGS